MREFTTVKLEVTQEEVEKIKELKYLSFRFKDSKDWFTGRLISIDNKVLTADTQGYAERVYLTMMDKETPIKLEIDRKQRKFVNGIVLKRRFQKATRNDWNITEEIDLVNCNKIKVELSFTQQEKEWLEYGEIPLSMDDKWFVYMENNMIHFFRSWTGIEVFSAQLICENDNWKIKIVNINPNSEVEYYSDLEGFHNLIKWRLVFMTKLMTKHS